MSKVLKLFYKFRRFGNSLFTFNCAGCGKSVRGCICEKCMGKLVPAKNENPDKASAYYYEDAARKVILCCKFYGGNYCMDILIDWLTEAYEHFDKMEFDFAVPVPSYGNGRNLAYYLAKEFSVLNDIPFCPEYIEKIRKTKKQHDISAAERRINLKDAFAASPEIKGKTVLLIDDIITTGATADECSKAMLKAGAAKICVLTVLKSAYEE